MKASLGKKIAALMLSLLVGVFSLPRPVKAAGYTRWDSVAAIRRASRITGINFYWLYRVARCESGLYPYAYNPSGASGLFQFLPATYRYYSRRYRIFGSPWNPYTAALVAAWMFRRGQSYQWVCR